MVVVCGECFLRIKMNIQEQYTKEKWDKKYEERKKLQDKTIKNAMKVSKPSLTDNEILLFEKELIKASEGKDCFDVLEWGSGYSTKYFTDFLTKRDIKFTWESIEYDIRWYVTLIKEKLRPNVRIHLFDQEILRIDDMRALKRFQMNEYVKFPTRLGKKYDFIFIDGRKRVRCMRQSLGLLKEGGVILLDDAHRVKYKEGINLYDGKFLTNKLWKGIKKSQ